MIITNVVFRPIVEWSVKFARKRGIYYGFVFYFCILLASAELAFGEAWQTHHGGTETEVFLSCSLPDNRCVYPEAHLRALGIYATLRWREERDQGD